MRKGKDKMEEEEDTKNLNERHEKRTRMIGNGFCGGDYKMWLHWVWKSIT